MKSALTIIFRFKSIYFDYSFVILNFDSICVYFIPDLSKKLTISNEIYFN